MNQLQTSIINRFPAVASRDFNIFLLGQFVSIIGTWMQATAQPYLAYRISERPFDLGLIGFANLLPSLVLAPLAGVMVERWDKRRTVIICQSGMAVLALGLAVLTFSGHIRIWQITVVAFLFGAASAVEITARQAMLIELTGRAALPSAIALQTTAFNVGRVIGPTLAAPFMAAGTEGTAFLINGISFIFVIVGLFFAHTRYQVPREPLARRSFREDFFEGLAYIRQTRMVAAIVIMAGLLGFFGMPLLQQIPTLGRDVLHTLQDTEVLVAQRTSALYIAQGVGALLAAFIAAYYSSGRRKGLLMLLGQLSFIFGLLILSKTTSQPLAFFLLACIGWGSVTQLVTMNTLIQLEVPNGLRGRVFAIYLWALQGGTPFGSLLVGWAVQSWQLPVIMLACGALLLASFVAIHVWNPQMRTVEA